jgi:hypothetical protein
MSAMTAWARAPIARSLAARTGGRAAVLRRRCACGQHSPGGGECSSCGETRRTALRSASGPGPDGLAPPIVHDVLRSPAQSLDSSARRLLEPRFAQDFSGVRVHAGPKAEAAADAVNARAFTVGQNIVLGQGHSQTSAGGLELMAHELAHTVQQADAPQPAGPIEIGPADHPSEREADRLSSAALGGGAAQATPEPAAQLRRQEADKPDPPPLIPAPKPLRPLAESFNPSLSTPLGPVSLEDGHKVGAFLKGGGPSGALGSSAKCGLTPGFKPGTGDFKGQCCKGLTQNDANCCPPEQLSMRDARCCGGDEVLSGDSCKKSNVQVHDPLQDIKVPKAPKTQGSPLLDLPPPPKPQYQDAPERVLPKGQAYA